MGVAVALAVTGCSAGPDKPEAKPAATASTKPTTPATPTAPPTSADPLAAEKVAVLKSYGTFLREQARAYEIVDWKATDVRQYVSGKALQQVHNDVQSLKSAGNHAQGAPKNDSKVTKITMGGPIPTATITSCMDVSGWKTVDKSGKPLPPVPGALDRFVMVSTLEKWPNGWMTIAEKPEGACAPRA
ncbi:hypothetical protein ACFYVL_40245 [Streptomyces sp. NPDC004111]|uniref:hypothetical protein n=1 Tax=Streptomyces sp. NPDC004111 TaxID=3364690 RepID=UPI0036CA6313